MRKLGFKLHHPFDGCRGIDGHPSSSVHFTPSLSIVIRVLSVVFTDSDSM